ncbi:unnamed protein product [Mytilus edulis]|uniref:Uncharacterized protein n=1 Tax=Mytilus edulis TaxID=6550 RepID=A0A8S3VML7_MYTED|nr:unnamed protein product [Mytilus edulis]
MRKISIKKGGNFKLVNEKVFRRQSPSVVTRERKNLLQMENVRDQEKSKLSVSKVASPSRTSITRRYSVASTLDQRKSSLVAPASVIRRARSKSTSIITTRNNADNQQSVLKSTLLAPLAAVKLQKNSKSSSHSRFSVKENGNRRRASEPTLECYSRPSGSMESAQNNFLFVPVNIGKWRSKSKSPIRRQTAAHRNTDEASSTVFGKRNSCADVFSTWEISMATLATIKRKGKSKQLHLRKNGLNEQSEKIPEIPETPYEDISSVLNNGFSSDFENTLKSLRNDIKFHY